MRLEEMLRDLPAPPADEARERAVVEARAEVAERQPSPQGGGRGGRRVPAVALASAVLAAAVLTPPGRDASAWVGQLVGIGDVGGSPTLERHGFDWTSRGTVVANGRAPDGSRYEWVVYRCKVDLRKEGLPGNVEGFGMSLEWPGVRGREGGGTCEETEGAPESRGAFKQRGVHIAPSQFEGVAAPDVLISGATTERVQRVEVFYTDTRGERRELPVDFSTVPEDLRERVGAGAPGGAFVAFVPGEWVERDDLVARLDLRALSGTGKLELSDFARRERRQVRDAVTACAPLADDVDEQMRCMEERRPPSPIEVVAYDEQGNEVERWKEPIGVPISPADLLPKGPMPWKERPGHGAGEPVVLAAGRAPGGARYEFFVEPTGGPGICTTLWWPRYQQTGAGGSCGKELPPESAFGSRSPEDVMAKPFGFLDDVRPATDHWLVSGFARPRVARVVLEWGEGDNEASAELVQVSGERLERMGGSEPFGYWVAFVPRAARDAEFEIVSYGHDGSEIGRYRWRSDVTN